MEHTIIKITEYCKHYQISESFIVQLREEGILKSAADDKQDYISSDELSSLDMFRRWHYELGINLEGIDAMRHLVHKIEKLQNELNILQSQFKTIDDIQK